ncbi:hypothetical protein MMC28_008646 [Mycoblastus sanguinarius]|nr:hypothetical protein [Mycoblastus sanguinarius]
MSPQLPDHVSSRAHDIIIACVVGPIVSTIIVSIRIWTRVVVTHNLGWDDYAAIVTLSACIGFSCVLGISTKYGMGLHLKDMTPELKSDHSEWIYISSTMYLISILGYRVALLLMYLRVFGASQKFRYATWAVLFFVTGYLSCNFVTLLFGCTPIAKYWKPDEPGHCINLVKADHTYGSMNVVSDFLMFLLPLPMVWQLQLSGREKLGLFLVFMSGIINFVVTTVRFGLLVKNLNAPDTAWLDATTFLFTVVEINTGLICSCTPLLRPFVRYILSKPLSNWSQQRSDTRSSSIWMGKHPDDQTQSNYRNYIELERPRKKPVMEALVREVME